jgi:7-keto-8-aminopelargonate synthetase-like enzyme
MALHTQWGSKLMSGHASIHEQLENELAAFVHKESAYLLNFGYKGLCLQLTLWLPKRYYCL